MAPDSKSEREAGQRPVWLPALGLLASFAWFGYCGWYIQESVGLENLAFLLPNELALMVVALFAPPVFVWLVLLYLLRARVASEELVEVLARFEALDVKPEDQEARIEGLTANLREQVRLLSEASEQAGAAAEAAGAAIAARAKDLTAAGEDLDKRAGRLDSTLKEPLAALKARTAELEGLLRDGEAQILKQKAAGETAIEEAQGELRALMTELGVALDRVKQGSAESTERAKQAGAELGEVAETLGERLKSFREASATLREELRGDAAAIREGEASLLSGAEELNRLTQAAAAALKETGSDALGRTEELKRHLAEMEDHAAAWQAKVDAAAAETRKSAQGLSAELQSESEALSERLRAPVSVLTTALEELRRRTLRLEEAAEKAGQKAEVLHRADLEARTEYFMRQAASVLDDLNGTAFDLARFLEQDVPGDLLKQYKAGDRSVFARRLARSPQFYVPEIRRRFEDDREFRRAAGHFITRFEELLTRASTCDPDNTIASAFLTADAGKLYMLLARSIGSRA